MTTDVYFYALRNDVLDVLQDIEAKHELTYTQRTFDGCSKPKQWTSILDLPSLGKCSAAGGVESTHYLISFRGTSILTAPVPQFRGGVFFDFNQLLNPETITFTPGGLWNGILIWGNFATASTHPVSKQLMRRAVLAVRKNFKKAAYKQWVGREAIAFYRRGARLTMAEQCPPEYNLQIPEDL